MDKEKYLKQRKTLMNEAQELIDKGELKTYEEVEKKIIDLDDTFEAANAARASMEALRNQPVVTNMINKFETAEQGTPTVGIFAARMEQDGEKTDDIYASKKYEQAFMNFVQKGTPIPEEFAPAPSFKNEITSTSDASAVIPTTILQEFISELKTYGNIYAKVRTLNIQGGVQIPILTLKPKASWIGEGKKSEDQKIKADEKVMFSYYGLECKIAQTLLASVVTLEMFQRQFVSIAVEAMVEALEKGIISGDGKGKPLGVAADTRIPADNHIDVTSADIKSWDGWKKNVFSKMKKSYRKGEFVMAQGTFDTYIDGLVDSSGQPIGRVNYGIDGGEAYRFGGKNVETVEDDVLPSFDAAAVGEVFGLFVDWSNYAINSNMQMQTVRWVDNDTNEVKNKCILICDGKLLDANGVLLLKKAEVKK